MLRRKVVITIENDEFGDRVWHWNVLHALEVAKDYLTGTKGGGSFPQTFKTNRGDLVTINVPKPEKVEP